MVFGIYEDGVVRASGHAGFASDADGLVEVDNTVGAFEHGRSRTCRDTWGMRALIATGDLVCSPCLWKHPDVNVLNVGACDRQWNQIFRFAGSGTGVATNASRMVDDLGPLHPTGI